MKNFFSRYLVCIVILILIAVSVFPGGKQDKAGAAVVSVDIYHRWGGKHQELMQQMIEHFNAKTPNIHASEVSVSGGLWEELEAKTLAQIAAGEEPPAIMVPGYYLVEHNVKTFDAVRLDKLGGKEAESVFDTYPPAILRLAQVNGVQYGLPFALSNPVFFYNADLFKKVGLDPKDPPSTWQETKEIGRIIKENTDVAPLYINAADSWYMQALIASNGGDFLRDGRPTLNSPEAVEAMKIWRGFYDEGIIPKITYREATESFQAEKMAMQGNSITLFQGFAERVASLDTAKMPAFGDHVRRLPPGGGPLVILARSDEKRTAAWELAKYMVSKEAMNIWVRTGYISPLDPAKVAIETDHRQDPAYEQLQYMIPWVNWPGPNSLEIEKVICDWRDKMLYGEVEIKKGCDELQKAVLDLIP